VRGEILRCAQDDSVTAKEKPAKSQGKTRKSYDKEKPKKA
jgi:hypothetical protein